VIDIPYFTFGLEDTVFLVFSAADALVPFFFTLGNHEVDNVPWNGVSATFHLPTNS